MSLKEYTVLVGLPAATTTTNGDGAAIDLQPYVASGWREIKAHLNCGTITGTTGTLTIKVQESTTTTSGDFSDITGAAFAELSTATGGETIHFQTNKRYVRFVRTVGGDTPSFVNAVSLVVLDRLV